MQRFRSCQPGLLVATMLLGAGSVAAQGIPAAGLDHIILYTGSLAQGAAAFARLTGVTPAVGGQHPGAGTQNALISLGHGQYLELLAPVVDSGPSEPLHLVGWAVRTANITTLRQSLLAGAVSVTDARPGSRRRPDGGLLTWRTVGVLGENSPFTPFFIEWGTEVAHPSTTSPSGCSLTEFLITEPDTMRLSNLVRTLGLPVIVRPGPTRSAALTIQCPRGQVRFTG